MKSGDFQLQIEETWTGERRQEFRIFKLSLNYVHFTRNGLLEPIELWKSKSTAEVIAEDLRDYLDRL